MNTNHSEHATDVWIGLSDNITNLVWKWQDGSNYNWLKWIPYVQPSPVDFDPNFIYSSSTPNADAMYWSTSNQSSEYAVICQKRQIPLTNRNYTDIC